MQFLRIPFRLWMVTIFLVTFLEQRVQALELSSPAFKNNHEIPSLYTAEGKDLSPPLTWGNAPKGTKSLALICEDPDAPGGNWVHWILYNIPPTLTSLEAGGKNFPDSISFGKNGWGNLRYGGPHPPSGTHHYHFTLYALDKVLNIPNGVTKNDLLKAMEGHILAQVQLIGTYTRGSKQGRKQ